MVCKCLEIEKLIFLYVRSYSRGQRYEEAVLGILMVFNTLLFQLCEFPCIFTLILAHYLVLVQL